MIFRVLPEFESLMNSLYRFIALLFTFYLPFCVFAKPPELDFPITQKKAQEILSNHVSQKAMNQELAITVLGNFIEIIDPIKTYFIENEVLEYTNPHQEMGSKLIADYERGSLKVFEGILDKMEKAISRRSRIEETFMQKRELIKDVDPEEFEELAWAKSEEELTQRIERIRSLQLESASKINEETREILLERLKKRRMSVEEEIVGKNKSERKQYLYSLFLKALCHSLDNHTVYFTPKEASQFVIQVQQRLFGIGALLHDDLVGLRITELIDGGPAKVSGLLKEGDRIIAVNNEPVAGLDIIDAVALIRGPKGSKVLLSIERDQASGSKDLLQIEIPRDEIVLKESRHEHKEYEWKDGVILHISLHSFYQDPSSSSTQDIKKIISDTRAKTPIYGIILDLRNNGGGLLPQAVTVSGIFIKSGIVASIRDDHGNLQHLRNTEEKAFYDGPLVVLTNRASASASEIVAQSLKDYGRALIVGDKMTFGKGSFQVFTLENQMSQQVNPQGEYKVTKGVYYTVSGKTPQLTGIPSDIVVPGYLSESKIGEMYQKNALGNQSIESHFVDDLSDIHPLSRLRLRKTYCKNLQPQLHDLEPFIPGLAEKSQNRIKSHQKYQEFITCLINKQSLSDELIQEDFQFQETLEIMKDYLGIISSKDLLTAK